MGKAAKRKRREQKELENLVFQKFEKCMTRIPEEEKDEIVKKYSLNNKSDDNREVWGNSCGNTKPEEERMNIVFKSMGIGLTTIGILFILSSIGSIIFFFKFV